MFLVCNVRFTCLLHISSQLRFSLQFLKIKNEENVFFDHHKKYVILIMLSLRTSCSFILVIVLSAQSSNYYSLLGVNKDASESDIKKAYRSLALEYHPDKIAKNATEEEKTLSKEKFLLIQEAYEILSDSEKRSQYNDAQNGIKYDVSNEPEVDRYLKNPFAMFLRTSRISMAFFLDIDKPEPPSLHLPIYIDGTAIFNGYKGNYTYYRRSICPVCLGKKGFEGKHRICTLCDGTGVANHLYEMNKQNIIQLTRTTCGACNGYGFIPDGQCTHCHGKGTSMIEHSVSFELPRGFPNGKKLIFHHLGHQISDGRTGHLYLEIQYLFNAPWKVDADNPDSLDMFYSLDVSIIEIVKGFKRHILGPDGSPMEVC